MAALRRRGRWSWSRFPPACSGALSADPPPLRPVVKLERTVLLRARVRGSAWESAQTPLMFGFSPSDIIQQRAVQRIVGRESSETGVADRIEGETSEAAGRYARAVFDLTGCKQLEVVEQDFAKFAAAWKEKRADCAMSPARL